VTAPPPDTRTPGQVLCEAQFLKWEQCSDELKAELERRAAAVLAHDASQRAARGEIVVRRDDLALALHGFDNP
jgi:hypothetical protein